jgi:thioredoxin reductase
VLVCDDGHPRNAPSDAAHCLLGNEGISPNELLAKARHELSAYSNVEIREDRVVSINRGNIGFAASCESRFTALSRKVLLTTGLKDELPPIDGVQKYYGRSVHHCPYCDGYENRGKPICVYGKGDKGGGLALMMKQWSSAVILCTDGASDISPDMHSRLENQQIKIFPASIKGLEGDQEGNLHRVVFVNGEAVESAAIFFNTGCTQASDLWQKLGCTRDDKGGIITDPLTEESSTPGVYVAGDASRDVLLLVVAMSEGAKAAVAINRALLNENGLG